MILKAVLQGTSIVSHYEAFFSRKKLKFIIPHYECASFYYNYGKVKLFFITRLEEKVAPFQWIYETDWNNT